MFRVIQNISEMFQTASQQYETVKEQLQISNRLRSSRIYGTFCGNIGIQLGTLPIAYLTTLTFTARDSDPCKTLAFEIHDPCPEFSTGPIDPNNKWNSQDFHKYVSDCVQQQPSWDWQYKVIGTVSAVPALIGVLAGGMYGFFRPLPEEKIRHQVKNDKIHDTTSFIINRIGSRSYPQGFVYGSTQIGAIGLGAYLYINPESSVMKDIAAFGLSYGFATLKFMLDLIHTGKGCELSNISNVLASMLTLSLPMFKYHSKNHQFLGLSLLSFGGLSFLSDVAKILSHETYYHKDHEEKTIDAHSTRVKKRL